MADETEKFGKVAVLMGGLSAEREISLQSGHAVLTALQNKDVDAHAVDVDENIINKLMAGNYQCAFIALHGRGGEDGTMQGLLEIMNVPYTGSGVQASSLAIDKLKTKQIWRAMGLPTPDFFIVDSEKSCQQALATLGLPLIIKPVLEGSSIGMSKVEAHEEMIPAWQLAQQCGGIVIAESWIEGDEYTAAILDDMSMDGRYVAKSQEGGATEVLPMIKLKTSHKFYDYDAKYDATDTQYICPCGLSDEREVELAELSKKAFDAVNASAWGRVDFIIDESNQPWLIEVNTVPGMTSHSLVPIAAKQAGISFDDLVLRILNTASCELC